MLKLAIAFQDTNRLLSLCVVEDEQLLRRAAQAALAAAESEAVEAGRDNPALGAIRRAELLRLRTVLSTLLPGFENGPRRTAASNAFR